MKKYRPLILAGAVFSLLFILANSLFSPEVSSRASGFFTRFLTPLLERIVGRGNVTEHLIRKLAHFAEFAFYGLWLALWVKSGGKQAVYALLAGFITAFLDETLQMFTGRGPSVKDVWIDLFGVAAGIGFVHVLLALFRLRRKKAGEE